MNLNRFLHKCSKALDVIKLKAKPSYSQAGEDLIVQYYFNSINLKNPTYLEIGTNQPVNCNNTYLFYKNKCTGVCVEPDTGMIDLIKKTRPRDTILNVGVGTAEVKAVPFYTFPGLINGWNTFSLEEATLREKESGIKPATEFVNIQTINSIIATYFKNAPNFISIDVEGLDLDIIKTLDFNLYSPEAICIETITFSTDYSEQKIPAIPAFMATKGYDVYADTHVNTIFTKSSRKSS